MQNQQMATMAAMNANAGGPPDGTPIMGNMTRPGMRNEDPRNLINTYIYDYFIRNNHYQLAQSMIKADLKMNLQGGPKQSPSGRNVNGVDAMDSDEKELPMPNLPVGQVVENSFLMDWWCQFWDIYSATRNRNGTNGKSASLYSHHARNLAQMQHEQRNQRMMMTVNPAQYQNMMRSMPNGVAANDLKRAAAMNNRNPSGGNPMNMNQMGKQAMMSAQMQRDGSGMDMNGQRPQSPGSNDAPSPNKRPRVEGNMTAGNQFNEFAQQGGNVQQKSIEVYAQSLAEQQRIALNSHAMAQGMNPGVQGSPMHQGLEGQSDIFAANPQRPNMPAAPGQPQGNHALQDYQMQLMLLEQQNKKRLLMARQEQDSMSAGPHQPAVGAPGFPPAMSPQGSRAGPSPNPADQMKRGTPKLNQQGLPGSPMPDASMHQQRNSPTPSMNFDPSQMPPGMPPQFPGYQMGPQNAMMRPPNSHPVNFNGQQLTPQQMEAMRQNPAMANGAWRGPGGPQGMMQGQVQQMGGSMSTPQRNPMPPPPAPPADVPRTQEPSPSQPAQAPPTPSQSSKPNPKKKPTKDNKKPAKAKGANTGVTPAASAEDPPPTPTPSTPITPMHKNSFANGQQAAQAPAQQQPAAPPQPQPPLDNSGPPPFGNGLDDSNFDLDLNGFATGDALENFDFDSFLHVGDDPNAFSLGDGFGFGDGVEAGADI